MILSLGCLQRAALVVLTALVLAACDTRPHAQSAGEANGVLVLGLLPDEEPRRQAERYTPLMEAIKSKTGLEVRLVQPSTYAELVDLFVAEKVDAAYFGGYTFLLAHERKGAHPLVMRDIDAGFVSYVLVGSDSAVRELSELRGARFSFGSKDSTSGHLMPRYFFDKQELVPEEFFGQVTYSGSHDRTFHLVADGTVDAGVANGQVVRRLLEESSAREPPVRIVWQSPPYVDYTWAVQSSMSEKTRRAITEVFLSLSHEDERQRRFLDEVGARYFLPAALSDFDGLRAALASVRAGHSIARTP